MLSSGPPELPWLIAASVWIASRIAVTPFGAWISRLMAETMPDVTVRSRPNGLPMATTPSPTLTSDEEPSGIGVREEAGTLDLEQRDVGRGVGADHAGLDAVVVGERDVDRARALDDVGVGDDVAVLVDHEAAALAVLLLDADDARAGLVVDLADAQLAARRSAARSCASATWPPLAACACWMVTVFVPPSSSAATPAAPAPPASRATSASGRKRRPKPPPRPGRVLARRLVARRLRGPGGGSPTAEDAGVGSAGSEEVDDRSAASREPNRDSTERGAWTGLYPAFVNAQSSCVQRRRRLR